MDQFVPICISYHPLVGGGSTKLKNATHSGSNAYILHGGVRYYLGEVAGEKKVFHWPSRKFQ